MKKSFLTIFAALCCTVMAMANAEDFIVNGIKYYVTGTNPNTVEVIANENKYSGDIVIPATVTNGDTEYNVTRIGDYAFEWCSKLNSVSLPEGLQSIGEFAFSNCGITGSLTIPSTVTNIGECAFHYCTLTSVTLLKGQEGLIKTIGRYAFHQCSGLQSVSLPEGVQSIGSEAFSGCSSLQSVSLPEGLQSIGNGTFFGCSDLQSVSLPEGLQSIGENAFSTSGITGTLTIPSTMTSIGKNAFINTGELNEILVYSDNLTTIGEGVWSNSIPTYVTGKSFEKYRSGIFQDYNVKLLPGADNIGDAIKNLANLSDAEADAVKSFLKVLNTMGTKQEGPAVVVTKGEQSVTLYGPDNVKFIKTEEK